MLSKLFRVPRGLLSRISEWRSNSALNKKNVGIANIISAGTEITGDIVFSGGMSIHGRVSNEHITENSTATRESALNIEEGSNISTKKITCRNITINGTVSADFISCAANLEIGTTAVLGECRIQYNQLTIAPGAQLNGVRFEKIAND